MFRLFENCNFFVMLKIYNDLCHLYFLQAAIANAKTLEEVERLNQMLKTGQIPGRELKRLRGEIFQHDTDTKVIVNVGALMAECSEVCTFESQHLQPRSNHNWANSKIRSYFEKGHCHQ